MSTTAPGPDVQIRDFPSRSSLPVGVSRAFMPGLTDRGVTDRPVKIQSLGQFVTQFGARQSDSPLFDAVDGFFRAGGAEAWISRVTGPNPVSSTVILNDSGATPSLTVSARSAGAWGNNLAVEVTASGGSFTIIVKVAGVETERSPALTTVVDAVAWADRYSNLVTLSAAGANPPAAAAATALTGGTDDRAAATDTEWGVALDRFTRDLGLGQVLAPGRTTDDAHHLVMAHAETFKRAAFLDAVHTDNVTALTAQAAAHRPMSSARDSFLFAMWPTFSGVQGIGTRLIPPSAAPRR